MERLDEMPAADGRHDGERGAQERGRRQIDRQHDGQPGPETDSQAAGRDIPPSHAEGRTLKSPWLGGG